MTELTPGRGHFLQAAVRRAKTTWEPTGTAPQQYNEPTSKEAIEALTAALKQPDVTVHVDIGARLPELTLQGLPPQVWPRTTKTDALASEIAKLKKKGLTNPFVFVDLKMWVPPGIQLFGGERGKSADFGWKHWHLATHSPAPRPRHADAGAARGCFPEATARRPPGSAA